MRERGEPDTNSDSVEEDIITSGLGTEERDISINKYKQQQLHTAERCVLVGDGVHLL